MQKGRNMSDILSGYTKKKEYLVCIDSDGCAMNTMDIKHKRCFGPCMVEEWGLKPREDKALKQWNDVNLYSMTRGINRFKALEMVLKELGLSCNDLSRWVRSAKELSESSLEDYMEGTGNEALKKVLCWSKAVNRRVEALPDQDMKPFDGVLETVRAIHHMSDVAIVSSANQEAILKEWRIHGLLEYTDLVLSQNAGSKSYCMKRLMEKGYEGDKVLMVGDAPGDMDAAASNRVFYFPILAGYEAESWKRLLTEGIKRLAEGSFGEDYQKKLMEEFQRNLS